jgi:septal ring factor EnvC (AmiA/AmiB activator)
VDELQQQLQRQEQRAVQQQSALHEKLQHWKQQYAELQEQSRQQQEEGLQQLSERLKEAINQKQEVHARLSAQLGDLQQQLHDSNAAALQAAAEKSALTAQLAAAEQAKGERTVCGLQQFCRHKRKGNLFTATSRLTRMLATLFGQCLGLCSHVLWCAVPCCGVPYPAVLCCAVLCCAVLCCAVLCCAVLCLLSAAELSSRLDMAGNEVADMRDQVQDMAQRMAERDEAVAAELHKFQHEQLAKQQQQLSEARAAAESAHATLNTLRDSLLAIHTALSPHSLATALGRSEGTAAGFSLGPEGYEQLTSRLLHEAQAVTAADGEAVAARVRELLAQVRGKHTMMHYHTCC